MPENPPPTYSQRPLTWRATTTPWNAQRVQERRFCRFKPTVPQLPPSLVVTRTSRQRSGTATANAGATARSIAVLVPSVAGRLAVAVADSVRPSSPARVSARVNRPRHRGESCIVQPLVVLCGRHGRPRAINAGRTGALVSREPMRAAREQCPLRESTHRCLGLTAGGRPRHPSGSETAARRNAGLRRVWLLIHA
jgi:hypothetical protein